MRFTQTDRNPVNCSLGLCDECYFVTPQETIATLSSRVQVNEQRIKVAQQICATCCGTMVTEPVLCESLDCPWMYSRKRERNNKNFLEIVEDIIEDLSDNVSETTHSDQSNESEVDNLSLDSIYQTPES